MNSRNSIVVFGGSFNPVHVGHEIIIDTLKDYVEKIHVIPSYDPPHKNNVIEYDLRLKWLKAVFGKEKKVVIDEIEKQRGGKSYTVDTLVELGKSYENIYLLIGEDSLRDLKTWHRYEDILRFSKLLVYPRYRRSISSRKIAEEFGMLSGNMSSELIRKRIRDGLSVKGMVSNIIYEEVVERYCTD